jgi:alkyldihydroxyacetonephosphate synthase
MAPKITTSNAARATVVAGLMVIGCSCRAERRSRTCHFEQYRAKREGAQPRRSKDAAVPVTNGNRSLTGWGFTDAAVTPQELALTGELLAGAFPGSDPAPRPPAVLEPAALPPARLRPPSALDDVLHLDPPTRALHALGRSYADVVRAFHGDFSTAPDAVATPRTPAEVAAVLDWCEEQGAACIPFGGGTSVVGGVTPPRELGPVVTLQLRGMDRVLEVDPVSLAARVQAGASGPVLEEQLSAHGLTARFYPQSFELSTVGGWIATRAGGHYATRLTHIDDLVEAVSAVTPTGAWASRRLPASGAGPSPDRLLLGSEGILGVITDAWLRVQRRPTFRASRVVRFPSFAAGADAVRVLAQSGLDPANCRLLDPLEALLFGGGDGARALLVLGFESAAVPVDAAMDAALGLCRDAGGDPAEAADGNSDAAGTWRESFVRMPYLRDGLVAMGFISETFETAVTWDGFAALHAAVTEATTAAAVEVCGNAIVTCRLTHAYPDGTAPYFTVIAPGRRGAETAQWAQIKAAAAEALLAAGGTITHHHAVGRDHRPWYDRQRPEPFAAALAGAKQAVDPAWTLNPGVLLPGSARVAG